MTSETDTQQTATQRGFGPQRQRRLFKGLMAAIAIGMTVAAVGTAGVMGLDARPPQFFGILVASIVLSSLAVLGLDKAGVIWNA